MVITGYQPASLFENFEAISAIPRPSGKEEKIAAFLCDWAEKHGIEYTTDANHNVFMKKPATPGYEDRPAVLLQGHTDMVCEKNAATEHDFTSEPLTLVQEGEWLRADGTTLGADDGTAVALMMSALTEPIPHPALECLFTADEEVGMSGANRFDYSQITAERMINLDSEAEGVATVSCAGGARVQYDLSFDLIPYPTACKAISVSLTGLSGGHSGADIDLGHLNANNALARVLSGVYEKYPFHLLSFCGGSVDNAITRECTALLCTASPDETIELVRAMQQTVRAEAVKADAKLRLRAEKAKKKDTPGKALTLADTSRLLDLILLAPTGVIADCPAQPDLVQTSSNLGRAHLDGTAASLVFLARSSSESAMDALLHRYARLARRIGAEITVRNRYPGWELCPDSPLQKQFLRLAPVVYGKDVTPRIVAIHAGLECGVILSSVSHPIDAISVGPDIRDIHTPAERLLLPSFTRLWELVVKLLEQ